MARGKRVRVVVASPYTVITAALEQAIERGMNRCDKYHETPLTESQRNLLLREIDSSFWLALDDASVEIR